MVQETIRYYVGDKLMCSGKEGNEFMESMATGDETRIPSSPLKQNKLEHSGNTQLL
jgi:hypothetical protein